MTSIFGTFGLINWVVLILFLAGTTFIGHLTRGNTGTMRGFFLGGRSIPWWAVGGSIVATQTSALTFIAVPAAVFKVGGNLTYHQMIYGMIIGNLLMAFLFVRAYYEREIYSPYDFMEDRLGAAVSHLARGLFMFGAVLSQGVRLLSTALILSVVTGLPVTTCVIIIGFFAVIWTLMGGITTVIWTDVVQFSVFTFGALFSIVWIFNLLPFSIGEILSAADQHAKLMLFDLSTDPRKAYTLWAGLVGFSFLQLCQNAIDQVSTQRIMCCSDIHEAKKSVIFASIGSISTVLMLIVGLLLWSHYLHTPPDADTAALLSAEPDRVFPHFIVTELPAGLSGIIIAALFAAGISTLDSALAALSQTFVFGVYRPLLNPAKDEKHYLAVSRIAIVAAAFMLCGIAILFYFLPSEGLLNLGLKVPGYVYGPLLGIALLALFRRGSTWSIFTGAALSLASILFLQHRNVSFFWWYPVATCVMVAVVFIIDRNGTQKSV